MKFLFLFFITFPLSHNINSQGLPNELNGIYSGYRKTISEIRPSNCPMIPSCSQYSEIAIENKGLGLGLLLTTDRLMRCGHELSLYDIVGDGKFKDINLLGIGDTLKDKFNEEQFLYKDFTLPKIDEIEFFLYLAENELHREVILEYNRIKFFNKNYNIFLLEYNYIRSLFSLGMYEKIIEDIPDNHFYLDPLFDIKLSESFFKIDNFNNAELILLRINNVSYMDKKNEFLAYVYAHDEKYLQSLEYYEKISPKYIYNDYISLNKNLVTEIINSNKKSRTLGGVLSIFPGGGYFYSNQITTGITSLFLNSLFAFATYSSFNNNNKGMGVLTGVFGTAFYLGNIIGGVKAVDRYNENLVKSKLNKMKYSFNN